MIKYWQWQALVLQLPAFTIRELRHSPAFLEPVATVKTECTCVCSGSDIEEAATKEVCFWIPIGSFAAGVLLTLGVFTYCFKRRPTHELERQAGSPGHGRRGGGVLSGPEGRTANSPLVH